MIQPSMERTATAPVVVCWSVDVVEGLEDGGGGEEESMSISLEAMVWVVWCGVVWCGVVRVRVRVVG